MNSTFNYFKYFSKTTDIRILNISLLVFFSFYNKDSKKLGSLNMILLILNLQF